MSEKLPSLRIGNLESDNPIVLGGMSSGLTKSELAAEIANNGGYGTIGGVGLGMSLDIRNRDDYFQANESVLKYEIQSALEASNNGNIGVNLMVAATDYENSVRVAVENGAKFIVSGAGLPLSLPDYVEKYRVSGIPLPELIPIVSSVRAAEIIIKKWGKRPNPILPAAFVIETPNAAGGHLGVTNIDDIGKDEFSLESVIPKLVETLENSGYDIPVIAAGGIWDRGDVEKMLKIGAKGVQMATRFLTTNECGASQAFKDRHLHNTDPIVIIKSPVGMPGRAIENDFVRRTNLGERFNLGPCVGCLRGCGYRENKLAGYCIIRALDNVHRGDVENGILFTGSNSNRLKEDEAAGIASAGQIMRELTGAKL